MRNRILFLVVFCGLIASASAQSNLNRFTFNVGGGYGIGRDDVASFVGNSFNGVAGAGINFTRMFGADAEYMYYNLNLRPSVSQREGLPDATGNMQSFSLDGIVHAPHVHGRWGAYGIFGVGFYDRSVSTRSQILVPGTICQPAYVWWNVTCIVGTPPTVLAQQMLSTYSKVAGGFNYGGGVTRPLNHFHNAKLYVEGRYHRAYQSDDKTIVIPITVGLRW